jgi:hypothetical protein
MNINQPASGAEREEYLRKRNARIVELVDTIRSMKIFDARMEREQGRLKTLDIFLDWIKKLHAYEMVEGYNGSVDLLWRATLEYNELWKRLQDFYWDLQTLKDNAWYKECVMKDPCIENFPYHRESEKYTDWDMVIQRLEEEFTKIKQTIPRTRDELIRTLNKN